MTFPSKLIQVHMPPLTATEVIGSSAKNLTATGTTRTDSYQLKDSINSFSTVASGTGARLPACENNCMCVVNNYGASTLTVYPFETSGVTIDGATSFQVAANKTAIFFGVQTNWITVYDTSSGGGGGGTAWGSITGTLSDQTDLQTALDAKLDDTDIGVTVQAYDAQLSDIAGLTPTDNGVIIGNGTNFVVESGSTIRTSLGLAIGTDVQAYDAQLADVAGLTPTANNVIIGNGTNLVMSGLKTINGSSILGSGNITGAGINSGTVVTLTTQTSVDFTGIPSGTKRITLIYSSLSTNGTSVPIVQIGDSGGIEATGYLGSASSMSGVTASANHTTGIGFSGSGVWSSANITHGAIIMLLVDASTNTWVMNLTSSVSSSAATYLATSSKSLSDVLTQVRLTITNGTDQFDGGKVQIFWE